MGRRRIEHNGKARIAAGELGSLTIDDLEPAEEAPDKDPDDRLFAAGFFLVDLET